MKPILLATAAATALLLGGAHAADLTQPKLVPIETTKPLLWRGAWAAVGLGWSDFDIKIDAYGISDGESAMEGVIAGGYDFQVGPLVAGPVAELRLGDYGDTDMDARGMIAGRVGIASGPNLFYAIGGVERLFGDEGRNGWTLGGGYERQIPFWDFGTGATFGVEARYTDFNDGKIGGAEVEVDGVTLTARVGVHF